MLEEAASSFQAVQAVTNGPGAHSRLKLLGFTDLGSLHHFLDALAHAMQIADFDINLSIKLLKSLEPEVIGSRLSVVANLKRLPGTG